MTEPDTIVACTVCGTRLARRDMFGVEPDLLCPRCASGVRKRMQVRVRHVRPDRPPIVTVFCLAVSVVLAVLTDLIYPMPGDRPRPEWLHALYQDDPIWIGEVWRHLTCMFLHGGWWHILMNGMALWFLGRVVEAGWGHAVLIGLILATGLASSAAEWIAEGSGVGLSGMLFGLCGFMWALRRDHPYAAAVMNERMIRWILTLLALGILLSITKAMPIGNWAHGAGLVTGGAIGLAAKHRARIALLALSGVAIVGLVVLSVYFAIGEIQISAAGRLETWPRARWRTYWIEHYAGR